MSRQVSRRDALRVGAVVGLGAVSGCSISVFGSGGPDWNLAALSAADGSERWTTSVEGGISEGGLALADGTVFALGDFGLWALTVDDGSQQWQFDPEGLVDVRAPPTVSGDDVYFAVDHWVRCLATAEGSDRWQFATDSEAAVTTTPARVGDAVVFGCENGDVYAVEAADGAERWRVETGETVEGGPGVGDGLAVVGTNTGRVSARALADGTERWRLDTSASGTSGISPGITVADGVAYVSSPDGTVTAVGTAEGDTRWEFPANAFAPLRIHDGAAFGGYGVGTDMNETADGTLTRLDLSDGRSVWSERIDQDFPLGMTPAVGDDVVCCPTLNEGIHAFSLDDGSRQWQYDFGPAFVRPRMTAETVFVGTS